MGPFNIFGNNAELKRIQAEYNQLKVKFAQLKTDRDQLKVAMRERLSKLKVEFEQLKAERDQLKVAMSEIGHMEAYGLQKAIVALKARKNQTEKEVKEVEAAASQRREVLNQQINDLNDQIVLKQKEVVQLDDEALLQSFGLYKPKYELANSSLYKAKLDQIQSHQAQMVKAGTAARSATAWTVNNSQKEGERMIKDYVKLILRSFNNECEAGLAKVKFNNVDSIEKQIKKAFDTLNKLGERMSIALTPEYLALKLEELYLFHEYQMKKQEEKETQKLIRQQMREEAKIMKEIEEARSKLKKEAKHFNKALTALNERLNNASTSVEREILETEKATIEQKLADISVDMVSIEKREQNTRAGYVYIISNIGSFGEDIYKIGVTRRLEPQDRIDELGSASVPFKFDVHALIFSEDAPALETALHRAFDHRRLNRMNKRREFFRVTLDEIESVVKTNFAKPVEFIRLADAPEFRQSLMFREDISASPINEHGLITQNQYLHSQPA